MKILVACCVIDYNQRGSRNSETGKDDAFVPSLINLFQGWDGLPSELVYFEVWRTALQMAQECCVREAMEKEYSHILFIEDDTTKIPDGALRKLVNHNKDVVAAYAYARHFPHFPTIFKKREEHKDVPWTDYLGPGSILINPHTGLRRVDMVPFQFTLMKTEVFERTTEPWFEFFNKINGHGATDQFFSENCIKNGVELWCDTDVIVQHAGIDENTAGFYVWKEANKHNLGKWMPASTVPFMQAAGINVVAEEVEDVYSKVQEVREDNGGNSRPK